MPFNFFKDAFTNIWNNIFLLLAFYGSLICITSVVDIYFDNKNVTNKKELSKIITEIDVTNNQITQQKALLLNNHTIIPLKRNKFIKPKPTDKQKT